MATPPAPLTAHGNARSGQNPPPETLAIAPDPALWEAARQDCDRLRRDYMLSVRSLEKSAHDSGEWRQAQARLRESRAALAQALTIMDMAAGDR